MSWNLQELFNVGPSLAGAAVGVVTAGTISGTTAAGAAPTVAIPTGFECTDRRGTFELSPVTGGGAQAAGVVATVRFLTTMPAIPSGVTVQVHNVTTTPDLPVLCSTSAVTTAGFDILTTILTTAQVYRITYVVIP